jgi:flagellar protein FlgJ
MKGAKQTLSTTIDLNSHYYNTGTMAADKARDKVLEEKLNNKTTTDEELMEVCKSFETYFLEQVMKGMEKTIPYEGKKNPYLEQFGDILNQEYAKSATENQELGLAKMLYESMKRNS